MAKKSSLNKLCHRVARITEFNQPSILESFNIVETPPLYGTTPVYKVQTDIYMLFNQQRLDKMTEEALLNYLNNFRKKDDVLDGIRSKLSDKQLATFVKSRYIQTPSELKSWSSYLTENYANVKSEIDAIIAQQTQTDELKVEPTQTE